MSELDEYVADHQDVINAVAKKLDRGEDVPAADVHIYVGFQQLVALSSAEHAEKAAALEEELRVRGEAYRAEAEHATMVLDALMTHSLELWENAS